MSFSLTHLQQDGAFAAAVIGSQSLFGVSRPMPVCCPIDGRQMIHGQIANADTCEEVIPRLQQGFGQWRRWPAPKRGELIRCFAEIVRQHKDELAEIITLEAGKTTHESLGEVQEVIDICDFAVGLSRQLYGLTIASERPLHRMMEQWHPLGPVMIITAFNFPMAVWAWNATLALVCGNTVCWKPSEQTPQCALALQHLLAQAQRGLEDCPDDISAVILGDRHIGAELAADKRFPLVSATGSIPMGRNVAQIVAGRLGRSLLELGGNNAMVVTPKADLALALRAIVFSAVGTTGQRCTSLRRLIVHRDIKAALIENLVKAYGSLAIGDPRDENTLLGPLVSEQAYKAMQQALQLAEEQGGKVLCGGERITSCVPEGGIYVRPALVEMSAQTGIVQQETFAPILYLLNYDSLEEAIDLHNGVPQGLSSAIFSQDLIEVETFLSAVGSDCGIANANIGTSGAEIGGAFGGEKDTGGGRESGSDAWKNYMRRTTNTINYGKDLPLAQGIQFDL
jgi:L-aminoadipate-semialdehyde dehydrogenase